MPDQFPEGSVTTATLADAAVTTPKLEDGAVSADKLGSGAVLASLARQGFGAVPRGGLIMSLERNAEGLISAGYSPAGSVELTPEAWQPRASLDPYLADHTAIWTGSEMIVWGGRTPAGGSLTGGGRYGPATDSWTTLAAGAPDLDQRVRAVWTGEGMLVSGGASRANNFLWKPGTSLFLYTRL